MWPTRVEVWRLSGHLLPESDVLRLGIGSAGGWSWQECLAIASNAKRAPTILRELLFIFQVHFLPIAGPKVF